MTPNRFDRAAPRAAPPERRDDCNGNVIGSAVLADAGDQAARAAAGRFFRRAALRRRQGRPR
jgi:hypothetical protein